MARVGLDVELVDIAQPSTTPSGAQYVPLASIADTRFRFAEAVERAQRRGSAPMLNRIDLYGTLELRSDEMPQLLSELDQLLADPVDDGERTVLTAVQRLASRCRDDDDLALRFLGD
jgi:hypothetical protein